MWPLLRQGYRIEYRSVNPESLDLGDIIVFNSSGRAGEPRTVVHRFIGRVGPYFLESGDNTYRASILAEHQIRGRVIHAFDIFGKKVPLKKRNSPWMSKRFILFKNLADVFFLVHEWKDAALGNHKSFVLWKASEWYRHAWKTMGIQVPLILPRQLG